MSKLLLILTVIFFKTRLNHSLPPKDLIPITLLPDSVYSCCSPNETKHPVVYCYYGTHKTLMNIWQTVSVRVDMITSKYELYEGEDEYDVWSQYESSQSTWRFSIFNWGRKSIVLNPFNTTCLGIQTSENYTLKLHMVPVNNMLVGMFTLGTLLFFLSPILVHNQLFHYVTGIAIGVLASVLVLLYLIISLMPLKKPAVIGVMAGGSTIIFYFFQSVLENIFVLLSMYKQIVYGYLVVSGIISLIICYRFGPLSNPRSINIVKWLIQVASLVLVIYSSYMQEITVVLVVVIILIYNLPVRKLMINSTRNILVMLPNRSEIVRYFEPPQKCYTQRPKKKVRFLGFLTEEEYEEQGRIETARGLEEIRQYCRASPRRWNKIKRINREKFMKFVSGESHLSRGEIESKLSEARLEFTDDDE